MDPNADQQPSVTPPQFEQPNPQQNFSPPPVESGPVLPPQPQQQPPQAPMYGASQPMPQGMPASAVPTQESTKEYVPTVLLSYFLGQFGVDRFYLGYTLSGIFKLITFGGLGIWYIVDLLRITFGSQRGKDGLPLKGYEEHNGTVKIVISIVLVFQVLFVAGIFLALITSTFGGIQSKARDLERETDIKAMHAQIEAYYAAKGNYPTLKNLNDASFRSVNLRGLDEQALQDPDGSNGIIASQPVQNKSYGYQAGPLNCDNIKVKCSAYQLGAYRADGTLFLKKNLN